MSEQLEKLFRERYLLLQMISLLESDLSKYKSQLEFVDNQIRIGRFFLCDLCKCNKK